jgi:glycosyltransferase involved in cell wall biosynthesis
MNLWNIERGTNKSWNLIISKIRSVCDAKGPTFFSSGKWEVRKSNHEIVDAITATQLPITLIGAWFNVFLGIEPIYKYLTTHGWEIQVTGSFQEGTATIFKNKYDAKIVVLPRVKLTSDYLGIMSSCDIHLGLSKGEGWDMPAVEAMGMGLPVILSKNTAHLEYLYESELNSANLVLPAKDVISHTFIDCEETVANDGIWFFNKGNWYTPVQSQVVKSIAWWFNNYSDELRNDVGFEAFRVINKVTSPRRILLDTFKAVETK